MTTIGFKALTAALEARRSADAAVHEALELHFPPGTPVWWARNGQGTQRGSVQAVHYGDRLSVINGTTHKIYAIHAYDLVQP